MLGLLGLLASGLRAAPHGVRYRDWWSLGAGLFQPSEHDGVDAGRIEYRSHGRFVAGSRWLAGLTLGPHDFVLPYAGFYWELPLGGRLVLSPGSSVGPLSGGDPVRFSGSLQFRSSLELLWDLGPRQRLGLALQHVSNAELEHPNQGCNTQLLTYSVALGP